MPERTVLELQNVSKRFGGLVAVDQLSFSVRENEMLGLIGPNGSGKTTVINLISGALRPSAGEIYLDEQMISELPARDIARAGVARTFQLVRLLPSLTVLENVAAEAPTASLTYIDEKRIELARALASDPRILLLDEWLAGLNPTEMQIGIHLIRSLRDEGRTIVLVEHVMDAIRSLCDRCVVMNGGIKIAEGTPQETLTDPEVVRAYLGEAHA
jgi:branched-chain amino acid transport system ATP-binding protein